MSGTPDIPVSIDPLDTLASEQKIELRARVSQNLNAFLESEETRPMGSGWGGKSVWHENQSSPLFARMAWEIVNQNFESKLSDGNPEFVDRTYVYLCDFNTTKESGFETLSRTDSWIKQGRKNLVDYLLKIASTPNMNDLNNTQAYLHMASYAIAEYDFLGSPPDKSLYPREWKEYISSAVNKAHARLQQLSETI